MSETGKIHTPLATPGRELRLFLDSADPGDWERLLPLGFFHGVTTNPLLLERSGQPCSVENLQRLARSALKLGAREFQVQTWGKSALDMVDTGNRLAEIGEKPLVVIIKIPATTEGFQAASLLVSQGRRVTMTAVYTPGQVLAAAGLGAAYAAPYVGRLDDAGLDGTAVVAAMQNLLVTTGSATRLLTASLRRPEKVVELAGLGLDTFTFGPSVAEALLASDLTAAAAADFQRAAEAGQGPAR